MPSITRAERRRGKVPSGAARPASRERPVIVPIASKKLVKTRVKTSMRAASTPMRPNEPTRSTWPTSDRSGRLTSCDGRVGTLSPHPPALPSALAPRPRNASTITAMTVPETSPISSAALTLRTISTAVMTRVSTNRAVGIVAIDPPTPRPTGGELRPVEVTRPLSTKPMKAMNRPMPTVIAVLRASGTASKIIRRSPVTASSTMMSPLMTTRPIASGQVTPPTIPTARNELMPSPPRTRTADG